MRVRSPKKSILEKVLTTLGNAALAHLRNPYPTTASLYRAMRDFRELQEISDRQLRYVSRYVVDKKYITISRGINDSHIIITEAGRAIINRSALYSLQPKKQKRWDHKWRIVIFDIPDTKKAARDAFAGMLKRLGFVPIQKSVFACPYPCEEELEVLAEYYGIADYVCVILAEKVSNSERFSAAFDLH